MWAVHHELISDNVIFSQLNNTILFKHTFSSLTSFSSNCTHTRQQTLNVDLLRILERILAYMVYTRRERTAKDSIKFDDGRSSSDIRPE